VISILINLSKPKGNLVPSFTLFHREKVTNLILFSLGKKASPFLLEGKKIQSPSPPRRSQLPFSTGREGRRGLS